MRKYSLLIACTLATHMVNAIAAPLVIAHRGASGYRPEHTLEAYQLAIEMGADYIEPDLVATRDGHLVARHEPDISQTTDVASRTEFADRKRTVWIDGVETIGWFTVDFTLAELRSLRAVQPRPDRSKEFDGQFLVPTLAEIIALAQRESKARGRTIGIYPETKHPSWHCALGLSLEEPLLSALESAGWNHRDAPVFIQSFEAGNLQWLRSRTQVKLIQLVGGVGSNADGSVILPTPFAQPECTTYPVGELPTNFASAAAFEAIATYADGIGPWKRFLIGEVDGHATRPTNFVELAHAAGLQVHPWTFRNEQIHLLKDYAGDPAVEYRAFIELGVDGVFSDFPDTARQAMQ
ncbi:MAG: glycerophosphodiester phosphodiesterase [Acidibacter sp.]|jgi:glycerophosphoryl diester phosphodiesterase|nr:glycerophosphodiester phosphodiesterase [Acidibacter sp.]